MGPRARRALPPRRFECLFCEWKFRWNRDLEAHIHTHTRERPYHCDECGATFMSCSMLGLHNKLNHMGVVYQCHVCRKTFTTSENLAVHLKGIHRIMKSKGRTKSALIKARGKRGRGRGRKSLSNSRATSEAIKSDSVPVRVKQEIEDSPVLQIKLERLDERISSELTVMVEEQSHVPAEKLRIPEVVRGGGRGRRMRGGRSIRGRRTLEAWKRQRPVDQRAPEVKSESSECFQNSVPQPHTFPQQAMFPYLNFPVIQNYGNAINHNQTWDPSFFLHMNRYDPEDSCFSENFATRARIEKRKEVKETEKQVIFQNKRGRPTKEQTDKEESVVDPVAVQKGEYQVENLGGAYVKCPYCPKALIYSNLRAHLLIHTGQKPFSCVLCGMRFRQKNHMIQHIGRYHRYQRDYGLPGKHRSLTLMKDAEKDHSCAFCGKLMLSRGVMEKHLLAAHNDKLQRDPQ